MTKPLLRFLLTISMAYYYLLCLKLHSTQSQPRISHKRQIIRYMNYFFPPFVIGRVFSSIINLDDFILLILRDLISLSLRIASHCPFGRIMFDHAEDWAIALSVPTLLGPEPTTMKLLISNVENDITTIIPVMFIFIRTIGILN